MALFGKWEAVSMDNMEVGMKDTGVPEHFIEHAKGTTLMLEIVKHGNDYYKNESVNLKLNDAHFKTGQSFDTKNWLDQTQHWTIYMDGNKMIEKRVVDNNVVITNYEIKDGLLVATYQQGPMAPCTVKYKRA